MPRLVSFIVPTVDRSHDLERFLESADRQRLDDYEILIIDQGDPPVAGVERHRHVRTFQSPTRGLSHARNVGIRHAAGTLFVFADDDCVLDEGFVEALKAMAPRLADPLVFGFGNALNLEDGRPFVPTFTPGRTAASSWTCDTLCSISLVFNREAFDRVGGFDECFGLGAMYPAGEETDLLLRLFAAGGRGVYLEPLVTRHPKRSRMAGLAARYASFGVAQGALARKHAGNPVFLARFGYGLLRSVGGWAAAAVRGNDLGPVYRASLRGKLRGFRSAR